MRCFRIDRIYRCILKYIATVMGEEYILPPVLNLDNVYETSTPDSPVVFILNPGADPGKDLVKLAKRCDISDSDFVRISLGQGQEKVTNQSM